VNRYFICDHGRMSYRWMNRGDRIEAPLVRRGGELHATDWDEALEAAATLLRGAARRGVVLASPRASTDARFFARELFRARGGARDAQVVFPIASVAEEEGTFVNRDGRVQRYFQAKPTPGMARPAWWVFSELLAILGNGDGTEARVATAAAAFDRLASSVDAFRGLSYTHLGLAGVPTSSTVPVPA